MKIARLNLLLGAVFAVAAVFVAGVIVRFASAQEPSAAGKSGYSEASLVGGTPINAELNSSIDSKKAKSGDAVIAHTTEAVKSSDDRTILPKRTKLVGHITQASARSKGDSDSALGIGFDKAILKGGEEMPLNVAIRALAAPANAFAGGSGADSMSGPSGPSNYPSGPANNSGMNGTRPMSNGTSGYPGATGTSSEASATGGMNSSGELAPSSRGVFGLGGLRLSMIGADNAPVSVISSTGKNVHLDGGTRVLLVTETPASDAPGQ
jgi:hypothetical protein